MTLWNKSGLGDPTPEEIEERRLLTSEILAIAADLISDDRVVEILENAGLEGEFADDEAPLVEGRHSLTTAFAEASPIMRRSYQAVAIALARRICAGEIPDIGSESAKTYVFERTFAGGRLSNRLREQRVSFEEFMSVLREFIEWERRTGALEAVQAAMSAYEHPEDSDDDLDEALGAFFGPLYAKSKQLFLKRGLINTLTVVHVALRMPRESTGIEDVEEIKRLARSMYNNNVDGIF